MLLPVEMDLYTLKTEYGISFPNPRNVLNVTQELVDDGISWLDLQCAGVVLALELLF